VPDPSGLLTAARLVSLPGIPFAYVGPGSGIEFLPYFLSLLGLAGAACLAILQWPFLALLRRIKGTKQQPSTAPQSSEPGDESKF
jgi:hypothetical protein